MLVTSQSIIIIRTDIAGEAAVAGRTQAVIAAFVYLPSAARRVVCLHATGCLVRTWVLCAWIKLYAKENIVSLYLITMFIIFVPLFYEVVRRLALGIGFCLGAELG